MAHKFQTVLFVFSCHRRPTWPHLVDVFLMVNYYQKGIQWLINIHSRSGIQSCYSNQAMFNYLINSPLMTSLFIQWSWELDENGKILSAFTIGFMYCIHDQCETVGWLVYWYVWSRHFNQIFQKDGNGAKKENVAPKMKSKPLSSRFGRWGKGEGRMRWGSGKGEVRGGWGEGERMVSRGVSRGWGEGERMVRRGWEKGEGRVKEGWGGRSSSERSYQ